MNYDGDDELERMRLRRQQRREARQNREETGRAGSYREDFYTEDSRRSASGREHGRSPQAARYTSDEFGAQYGTQSRIMQSAAIAQEAVPIGRRAGLEQREGAPGGRPVPGQAGRSRELPGPHPFALDITALKAAQGAAKEEEAAEGAEALPVWIGEKRSLSLQEE